MAVTEQWEIISCTTSSGNTTTTSDNTITTVAAPVQQYAEPSPYLGMDLEEVTKLQKKIAVLGNYIVKLLKEKNR